MIRGFFLVALLLTLSPAVIAQSEDISTIPNKQEITDKMLEVSRLSAQEQDSRVSRILKEQAHSKTPRSDFMFCTGLAYLGNYKGQICLGCASENGLGIVDDLSQAYTWYELALTNNIADEADAKRAEADRDRVKLRLLSAYPHPTEDDLADMVNAQKTRIEQYQEQMKNAPK
ncbi:MAG: hypothetical protein JXA73_17605 [Acidobacteria bacterium]|nr:hypothetical protein [Acidobacteriota bacterium]